MSITATEARRRLFPLIEQVNEDQEAVEIVGKSGPAYLVPAEEYLSLLETAYLLQSPVNAARIRSALDTVRRGEAVAHELVDDDV